MSSLVEALVRAAAQESKPGIKPSTDPNIGTKLVEAFLTLRTQHEFRLGELVQWKPGLRNRLLGGPFIVTALLPEPLLAAEEKSGSAYWREPLDVVIGTIGDDGSFVEFHLDSRRLERWRAA